VALCTQVCLKAAVLSPKSFQPEAYLRQTNRGKLNIRLTTQRFCRDSSQTTIAAARPMSQGRTLRSGRILPPLDSTKKSSQPTDVSSLCFRDAIVRRNNNEITEDEYLRALLIHCDGTRHGTNRLCNNDEPIRPGFVKGLFAQNVRNLDRFTFYIALWISKDVCKDNTRTIDGTI
jgi:hypothetical protein